MAITQSLVLVRSTRTLGSIAKVVELVDTGDLKSPASKACRFDSGPWHQHTISWSGVTRIGWGRRSFLLRRLVRESVPAG